MKLGFRTYFAIATLIVVCIVAAWYLYPKNISPPDTTAPAISIVSPENKTYIINHVSLAFTVIEPTSWIGYSLDGQVNATITGNTNLTGLSDGTHSLIVYASDIAGNNGSSDMVYFTVDTALPSISIVSPENKTYDTADIPLTFTVDKTVFWVAYILDGQTNVTITGDTILTGLSDGSHSLIVYATDTLGNTGNSETICFTVAQKINIVYNESFEEDFGGWVEDADLPLDPNNPGQYVAWNVSRVASLAHSGQYSVELYVDGRQDDGTVWIEKKISVKDNSQIQVEISFEFYSEQESFNAIAGVCAYAGTSNPEYEADFVILGQANEVAGWKQYTHETPLYTGSSEEVWVAVGITVGWETAMTYNVDDVKITLT